nr:MAG TPA: hypothetical protein [Crassvirales sp.]
MTKKRNRLRDERPKAFWGALVGGAMNLIGSAISSKSQARAIRRQIEAQKEATRTQLELANNSNLASTLNSYAAATRSYNNEDDYNLKYRLGGNKRLGSNRIYITDGGDATKIGNDTYLLRGGSHEQTNETGQTGIGINVGGNEVEAEGGEVAQKKNGALRIFSAQPILSNGMSPAQAILRGYNKDKVFNAQQQFKKRNGLKDDGGKAAFGDLITGAWNFLKQPRLPIHNIAALATAYQKFYPTSNYNKQKGKFGGGKGFNGAGAGGTWTNVKPATRKFNNFNDAYDDAVNRGASTFKFGNKLYNTKAEGNPIRELNNRAVGNYRDTIIVNDRGKNYGVDFGPIKGPATLIPLVYDTYDRPRKRHRLGGGLTSKDRGSSKHPYPSVSSKDFAGGGRSYPIPTKADAVDALRLAGLHGRSDVKAKVYDKYPSLRKKSLLGSYSRPVKGMRTKFAIGGKEDKGYDMTGELSTVVTTANWRTPRFATLGSVDTTARAIPNFDTIKIPTYIPSSTIPYKGQNINRSRTIFSGGDYLGLGIDALSALGTGLITSNAYKNLDFNYNLPNFVEESPVALNTTYHNEAQKSNVERNRLNSRNSILRNTMSGSTAIGRMQGVDTNALYQLNQLADTKENKETELMNQNLLNEQQVRARNAAARNQYYNTVATIKNAALEAKNNASLARSQAFSTSLSGLSQAWNNFWTAGRTAYEDDQARRAMIASSKDATPTRLIEMGYNLSPQVIASLYNTSTDQRTKDFYLSMLDEKQRRKYGIS